jgi:membrane-associated phospholipid phosphatase/tRNA A-37 threonylcarbamoyl transferase component Bud32
VDTSNELTDQGRTTGMGEVSPGQPATRRRRRRPSGEPPPLPRQLGLSGKLLIVLTVLAVIVPLTIITLIGGAGMAINRFEIKPMEAIARIREPWFTDVMRSLNALAFPVALFTIRMLSLAVLIVFRRWRHLFVFVASVLTVELITYGIASLVVRPRPMGVTALVAWEGFSFPSRTIADIAVTAICVTYALLPHGRYRDLAKYVTAGILVVFGFAQVYLGISHPTDVLVGAMIGVTIPVFGFRWFCPNDVFPVTYGRGKTAHLDVGGRRGDAIRKAVEDQLGVAVTEIKPIGLEGSGGSTPVRLSVEGDSCGPSQRLFAKVYATNHVRADRWYKLGRTILYGGLEDETPFRTVRRFVEYEDYTLRLMYQEGLPSPRPCGVVEITPEREYLIAMEFFDGAVELGEAEVDDSIIDQGLAMIRRFWDLGLAHRDIKPSNLMVRDGQLLLVDVFFVQIRPSPWRQAVDLGNMMLTLALRTDAERVYERARTFFSEDELAEAFAATRGVASPTQVRSQLKADGRGLLTEFRSLAPERKPIAVQRWSLRRIGIIVGLLLALTLVVLVILDNWRAFL